MEGTKPIGVKKNSGTATKFHFFVPFGVFFLRNFWLSEKNPLFHWCWLNQKLITCDDDVLARNFQGVVLESSDFEYREELLPNEALANSHHWQTWCQGKKPADLRNFFSKLSWTLLSETIYEEVVTSVSKIVDFENEKSQNHAHFLTG